MYRVNGCNLYSGLFTHQSCDNKDKSSPMAGLAGSVLEVSNNRSIIDRHNNQVLIMSDQISRKPFIIWKSTTDTREKGGVISRGTGSHWSSQE